MKGSILILKSLAEEAKSEGIELFSVSPDEILNLISDVYDSANEWKPIDTAPLNEEILVFGGEDIISVAWANKVDEQIYWMFFGDQHFDPTHWMPLPEPPKA